MAAAKYGKGRGTFRSPTGGAAVPCITMPARDQRLLLGAALATSVLLLVAAAAGHAELLAYAAPLFLMGVPLLAGRYVGEEHLERMRSGFARTPCRAPRVAALPAGRRLVVPLPRGGRLIAHSLAERPPPAFAAS
jgi:hypothetical protein